MRIAVAIGVVLTTLAASTAAIAAGPRGLRPVREVTQRAERPAQSGKAIRSAAGSLADTRAIRDTNSCRPGSAGCAGGRTLFDSSAREIHGGKSTHSAIASVANKITAKALAAVVNPDPT